MCVSDEFDKSEFGQIMLIHGLLPKVRKQSVEPETCASDELSNSCDLYDFAMFLPFEDLLYKPSVAHGHFEGFVNFEQL